MRVWTGFLPQPWNMHRDKTDLLALAQTMNPWLDMDIRPLLVISVYYVRTISHISHSPHPSCFSLQASSRQRVAAGQACSPGEPAPTWTPWTPVSLQDTRASPVKVGDQLEGGLATHRPIRGGANVLPSISLFFLLSPFSVSHPGHWINTEEE